MHRNPSRADVRAASARRRAAIDVPNDERNVSRIGQAAAVLALDLENARSRLVEGRRPGEHAGVIAVVVKRRPGRWPGSSERNVTGPLEMGGGRSERGLLPLVNGDPGGQGYL